MKAIISHDVDHITVWEHLRQESVLPKFLTRTNTELANGKIAFPEFLSQIEDFFNLKWLQIEELIRYNKQSGIPSSFFVGMQNSLSLPYRRAIATYWMKRINDSGGEVGLHGLEHDNFNLIKKEYDLFDSLHTPGNFGCRMHYTRNKEFTYSLLASAGYIYDSTEYAFKNPYRIGNMWEFPFQIVDGWIIEQGKRWESQNLKAAIESTKQLIDKAHQADLKYLGIDFHERYFSKDFKTWMDWYVWLTGYLIQNGIDFIDFKGAIAELEINRVSVDISRFI